MVILDTNIIIDHLRQPQKSRSRLVKLAEEKPKEILTLSVVSVQELYEGKSTLDKRKEEYLLATISPLRILPYTFEVAELGGKIARDLASTIELADAAIAATAVINNAELYTLNRKHFTQIHNLRLFDF